MVRRWLVLISTVLMFQAVGGRAEKLYAPVDQSGNVFHNMNMAGVEYAVIVASGPVQLSSGPAILHTVIFPSTVPFTVGTDLFYVMDTSVAAGPKSTNASVGFSTVTTRYQYVFSLSAATAPIIAAERMSPPGYDFSNHPLILNNGLSVGFWTKAEAAGVTDNRAVVGFRRLKLRGE